MLSLEQIESFYPENLRIYKRNLLREYLQYVILEIIYRSEYGNHLIFMGGTAIHVIHDNQRFSEDLDFDNRGLNEKDFSDLSEVVSRKLKLLGYQVEINNKVGNAFRCLIKFPGIFYQYNLSGHTREKMTIQLDTEPQNIEYKAESVLINNFDILLKIRAVPVDILLAQKIFAILKRPRPMGRDFYDAIFLLSKTKPNYNYLIEKMGLKGSDYLEEIRNILLKKCNELDFKKLSADVKPFLFHSDDAQRILLFPEFIQKMLK
ncbi:MAG: nucleotidyl transferase AbiEii/AbiGii toxin family protein [Eubacteriaceae bacterium]